MSETEYIPRSDASSRPSDEEKARSEVSRTKTVYFVRPKSGESVADESECLDSPEESRGLMATESDSIRRLMSKTRRIGIWAERICRVYFSDPTKRLEVKKGEKVLTHGHPNDKLYYVAEGSFISTVPAETVTGEKEQLELFRSREGGFIGVRSDRKSVV